MRMQRGSNVADEVANADRLLELGAEDAWGWDTPAGVRRVARRVEFISRQLELAPGKTVLELGCGTGIFTRRIAATGAQIIAVDLSQKLIDEARRQLPAGAKVEFVVADLMQPRELAGRRFDGFYCVSVLHHLDLERALPAIADLLEPGARFAVTEPNMDNPINRYVIFTDDLERRARMGVSASERAFRKDELGEALTRHGFAVDLLEHRDFVHPKVPAPLVPLVEKLSHLAERTPGLRRISGSLFCAGRYLGKATTSR
jgi:2-polyprenyl-3-methyl-5-hydroxy-6-metoxy-1,4-benzoquinol methylase